MPHALLLEGPVGSAKFMLARALAQYIHCTDRKDGDSCGHCRSCLQHQKLSHLDTIYSYPYTKGDSRKEVIALDYFTEFKTMLERSPMMDFDEWVKLLGNPATLPQILVAEGSELIRRATYTAHASRYKIILMWLPEKMKEEMANKMLKLVEEPYQDTIFIMTSDNPRQILPTIYSRVQRIRVNRYSDDEVAQYLINTHAVDDQAARDISVLAEGSMTQAIKMISTSKESSKHLDWFIELMRLAYQRKIGALKKWSQTVGAEKREPLMRFLDYCCHMLRENFVSNLHDPSLNRMTQAESQFSVNFSRFINEKNVLRLIDAFNQARIDIAGSANSKIVLFDLSITVILLLK